jgi:ethanolamine transporter EutH
MAVAPPLVGTLIAYSCWRGQQMILGNIAGSTVIFGTAIALIMREYVELDSLARKCLDAGYVCLPNPGAFIRYALYAFIGLIEVFALFAVSLSVEEKQRRRGYDPEWR